MNPFILSSFGMFLEARWMPVYVVPIARNGSSIVSSAVARFSNHSVPSAEQEQKMIEKKRKAMEKVDNNVMSDV